MTLKTASAVATAVAPAFQLPTRRVSSRHSAITRPDQVASFAAQWYYQPPKEADGVSETLSNT